MGVDPARAYWVDAGHLDLACDGTTARKHARIARYYGPFSDSRICRSSGEAGIRSPAVAGVDDRMLHEGHAENMAPKECIENRVAASTGSKVTSFVMPAAMIRPALCRTGVLPVVSSHVGASSTATD